jgi:hypothetical protein
LTFGGVLGSRSNRISRSSDGLHVAFSAAIRTRCGARGFARIFLYVESVELKLLKGLVTTKEAVKIAKVRLEAENSNADKLDVATINSSGNTSESVQAMIVVTIENTRSKMLVLPRRSYEALFRTP